MIALKVPCCRKAGVVVGYAGHERAILMEAKNFNAIALRVPMLRKTGVVVSGDVGLERTILMDANN